MNFEYDEDAAGHADDFANRIDENGPYVGQFSRVEALVSSKGTKGMRFEFEMPNGGGKTSFSLYTEKEDGSRIFGFNIVQAMMLILGLKRLDAAPGKVMQYDEAEKKQVEVDGERYPALEGKNIGVFLQKELYTGSTGKDSSRMNLVTVFHPDSKLTAGEIKDRKVKPEKFEKILKGLRTKDAREKKAPEPSQPGMGSPVPAGEY